MAARAATFLLLLCLAGAGSVLGQPSRAQLCTSLAAPVPGACKSTIDFLNKQAGWNLAAERLPDKSKVTDLLDSNPKAKPSQGCCNAIKKFDDPGCGCEEPGPRSIDATTQGLQGLAWLASVQGFNFEPFECQCQVAEEGLAEQGAGYGGTRAING